MTHASAQPDDPDAPVVRFAHGDPLLPEAAAARPARSLPQPLEVRRVDAFVFRVPIPTPVVTSFGVMGDRPAVLVRLEDRDGAVGWGEVWANFPSCGAEHRARLVTNSVAPQLLGHAFTDPAQAFTTLERALRTLALQAGEWGPFAQVLAGIDIALWDLAARRADMPLAALIGGGTRPVPVYASGINLNDALSTVERCRAEGHRAFKIKVGFGQARDLAVVTEVARELRPGEQFMLDANQAWDLETAIAMGRVLESLGPAWLEEPMAADRPAQEWRALARAITIPVAGGENLRGLQAFRRAINSRTFGVVQPDACKWGGISGCATVAREVMGAGLRYCPHYLGAGIGLVASAHLLAAVGGDGLLEVDSNPNPLREGLAMPFPRFQDAHFPLPQGPGLGAAPDLSQVQQWLVFSETAS